MRDEIEDIDPRLSTDDDYGKMIAKKYYNKLYKEYAIYEFSDKGQIGLRWRTEPEVLGGKGETICGNKKCNQTTNLGTYEVNFRYKEDQEVKNTLVKVKCCKECSEKLNKNKKHKKLNDKQYTEEDIRRMLEKLEERKKKIKKEEE